MENFDPHALRKAFGSFLSGVTIVTTKDEQGELYGFTANSFTSVSLNPPMLLVCPGRFLSGFEKFENCTNFAISILAEGQEDVSNTFASFKGDRFQHVDWKEDYEGIPLIDGAAAHFSCKTSQIIPAGDHIVLLGEVTGFECSGARGLGYTAGQYFSLDLERKAASTPALVDHAVVGVIAEHEGSILLEETDDGLRPLQFELSGRGRVRDELKEKLKEAGLLIELDQAYSVFDHRRSGTHYTYFLARALDSQTRGAAACYPIHDLPNLKFVSDAHRTMLERYALEYESRNFALYIGDESSGDVHAFDKRS